MLRQVVLLLALLFFLSYARAQSSATIDTPDFQVTVSADLGYPQWKYSQIDNASYVYKISLIGMWEAENGTSYDLVAGSYINIWNGFQVMKGPIANFSQGVYVQTVAPNLRFDSFAVNTHIPMNKVNGSEYPAGKFDVEIMNYQWMSSTAQLVLAYSLGYEVNNIAPASVSNVSTHGSRTIDFNGGYFSINSTAMGGPKANTSISVALKQTEDFNSTQLPLNYPNLPRVVYVVYDHFDTSLKHDPEFGFGEGPGNSYIWIIIIVVVVIAIIVIILIAVIGFILVRRRRRSYDAF